MLKLYRLKPKIGTRKLVSATDVKNKMYDEAIASFDYAIFSDDTFTSPYIDKGKLLEKMKKYDERKRRAEGLHAGHSERSADWHQEHRQWPA